MPRQESKAANLFFAGTFCNGNPYGDKYVGSFIASLSSFDYRINTNEMNVLIKKFFTLNSSRGMAQNVAHCLWHRAMPRQSISTFWFRQVMRSLDHAAAKF
jgi:hypothetical protein